MFEVLAIEVLLIGLFLVETFIATRPVVMAFPYPFNRSESTRIECFSNDLGTIHSITILAELLDTDPSTNLLRVTKTNVTNNRSIVYIIPAPFNYSRIRSNIECQSTSSYGQLEIRELEVLSVAEIPERNSSTVTASTNQMALLHCLTYGTNVCKNVEKKHLMGNDYASSSFQRLPGSSHAMLLVFRSLPHQPVLVLPIDTPSTTR